MLVIPSLEKCNCGERAMSVGEKKIELRGSWRIHCMTRRADLACCVACKHVQLVQSDKHCLREIQ